MNRELAEKVADAVLYEGYMLYPYRPSALKNRQRWSFGTIYPPAYEEVGRGTEAATMHTECLLTVREGAAVHLRLRFLHLLARQVVNAASEQVASMAVDGAMLESWDEGVSRSVEIELACLDGPPLLMPFEFAGTQQAESVRDASGEFLGSVSRAQKELNGTISCSAEKVRDKLYKLAIDVHNETVLSGSDRTAALLQSFLSAHTILSAKNAEFISLMDPPEELRDTLSGCKNVGNFPVLVGEVGSRDVLLCSPIVLYDYPQIAPESAGDFFDATEMDEMLTLRVMTLTDEEKDEMSRADSHARTLLQRTEDSARQQLMRTHGVIRSLRPVGEKHD